MKPVETRTGYVIQASSNKYGTGYVSRTGHVSSTVYDAASWITLEAASRALEALRPHYNDGLAIMQVSATRTELTVTAA